MGGESIGAVWQACLSVSHPSPLRTPQPQPAPSSGLVELLLLVGMAASGGQAAAPPAGFVPGCMPDGCMPRGGRPPLWLWLVNPLATCSCGPGEGGGRPYLLLDPPLPTALHPTLQDLQPPSPSPPAQALDLSGLPCLAAGTLRSLPRSCPELRLLRLGGAGQAADDAALAALPDLLPHWAPPGGGGGEAEEGAVGRRAAAGTTGRGGEQQAGQLLDDWEAAAGGCASVWGWGLGARMGGVGDGPQARMWSALLSRLGPSPVHTRLQLAACSAMCPLPARVCSQAQRSTHGAPPPTPPHPSVDADVLSGPDGPSMQGLAQLVALVWQAPPPLARRIVAKTSPRVALLDRLPALPALPQPAQQPAPAAACVTACSLRAARISSSTAAAQHSAVRMPVGPMAPACAAAATAAASPAGRWRLPAATSAAAGPSGSCAATSATAGSARPPCADAPAGPAAAAQLDDGIAALVAPGAWGPGGAGGPGTRGGAGAGRDADPWDDLHIAERFRRAYVAQDARLRAVAVKLEAKEQRRVLRDSGTARAMADWLDGDGGLL